MTPEDLERIQVCASEIAEILYKNTLHSEIATFEAIEKHLRQQWLDLLGPKIGFFLSKRQRGQTKDGLAQVKAA